jgi:hypothetical protein
MALAVSGNIASAAEYNKIRSNVLDLDTRVIDHETRMAVIEAFNANSRLTALESLTTNTATNGGHGNVRLSDRLGTGVGTGANVTTGSATSQLTDVRSRIAVVETRTTDVSTGNTALGSRVASLEASSGGAAPYCKLTQTTTAQSIGTSATVVDWQTTVKSRGVTVNLTNNTVTILTAGVYWLTSNVSRAASAGAGGTRWIRNGSTLPHGDVFQPMGNAAGYITEVQNNILVELAVNDVILLHAFSSTAANTVLTDGHAPSMSVLYAAAS